MATIIRGSDNFNTNDNATQTELDALSPQRATAWVNFDGATGTIRDSYNILSVVRNSTGVYTITFSVDMDNTNYVCSTGGKSVENTSVSSSAGIFAYAESVSVFRVITNSSAPTALDFASVSVAIFGGKA